MLGGALEVLVYEFEVEVVCFEVVSFVEDAALVVFVFGEDTISSDEERAEDDVWEDELMLVLRMMILVANIVKYIFGTGLIVLHLINNQMIFNNRLKALTSQLYI